MKKNNPQDYFDFYLELPQMDYLKDIEIQDEYEKPTENRERGLSEEQVSQLAVDSLKDARRNRKNSQQHDDKDRSDS